MKKILYTILFFCACYHARSQTLSPSVLASSGGYYTASGYSLSSTVAEMTMVTTVSSGSFILTQGFQQPEDFGVRVAELPQESGVTLFPNPNHGSLALLMNLQKDADVLVKVFDAIGREVYFDKFKHVTGINQYSLDLSSLTDGMYWIEVLAEKQSQELIHTTQKINIIH
ncbi:MAG: T9SS type A sorting domain-containing protein [Bacteroidetes bacterium]|nr:T9SS type A sorting domain-containing protein [Bacteroidota bacterium]